MRLHRPCAAGRLRAPRRQVRTLLAASTGALLGAIAPRAASADVAAVPIDVTADSEAHGCADASTLAAAINHALGRERVTPAAADTAPLRLQVSFSRDARGYFATVRARGASEGTRSIRAGQTRCDALTPALADVSAMMIEAADAGDAIRAPAGTTAPPPLAADVAATAQEATPPRPALRTAVNHAFVEALGNGLNDSINYERLLWDGTASVRIGLGYAAIDTCPNCSILATSAMNAALPHILVHEFTAPVLVNWYWGTASHKLQIGLGATFIYRTGSTEGFFAPESLVGDPATPFDVAFTAVVGYRFIPYRGGPTFGGGFTPLVGQAITKGSFLPWVSLGVGVDL
jgi:hypothetical protein